MAVVTISRGIYSGGKELAECVANKLGYKCIAEEILVEAAKAYGVAIDRLEHAIKDKPGIFERMGTERLQALTYVSAILFQESKDENVVYHGHAGHFLFKEVPHVLKVRILADTEYRINAALKNRRVSRERAIRYIHKEDAVRAKWTRFLFHTELLDLSLYDLVINLEHTTLESACELVCEAIKKEEFRTTPASQKAMQDISLAYHVKSKLVGLKPDIEVNADNGIVHIMTTNGVRSDASVTKLENTARQIPGVKEVLVETVPASHPIYVDSKTTRDYTKFRPVSVQEAYKK